MTVKVTVVGSILTRGIELSFINIFDHRFFTLITRQSVALSSQLYKEYLENSAENGERSVLTLGSFCLSHPTIYEIQQEAKKIYIKACYQF